MTTLSWPLQSWQDYWRLGKPRVVALIVFCTAVGMSLADPAPAQLGRLVCCLLGIGLIAMAAAVANCLFEQQRDALMQRTARRATASGRISRRQAAGYALLLAGFGLFALSRSAPAITSLLTLATALGYAVVYTRWLKPSTPQNIVIGGAAGAMPPLLGWSAVSGELGAAACTLFLLIFIWTPPHFWALALYRQQDYRRAGLPMLPVTHGAAFTRCLIVLYSWLLAAVSLAPVAIGMSSWLYLIASLLLNARFVWLAQRLRQQADDSSARQLFRYSIHYLMFCFAALLADHFGQWLMF